LLDCDRKSSGGYSGGSSEKKSVGGSGGGSDICVVCGDRASGTNDFVFRVVKCYISPKVLNLKVEDS